MADVGFEELMDMAESMAQELTDLADDGDKHGRIMTGTRELLSEFDELWRRTDRYWKNQLGNMESVTSNLDNL